LRVAIVHHWFVSRGGGERVAECIASMFPQAEIFSLVATPRGIPASFAGRILHTSFLQKIPFARSFHRHMMPFYPWATESLDLSGFDLVLSSDSGTVKGVILDPGAVQICYCHSPMRYLWDNYEAYRKGMGWFTRVLFTVFAGRVRRWDVMASARVTYFLANSHYVAGRIRRFYGRESTVIHPPIDLDRAVLREVSGERPYLAAGRLVSYKRTELMIEACRRMGRELRIAGTGPEEARLRSLAGEHVTFLGEMPNDALWREYSLCRALLFAADEDFGMVPLEAQACGRPVIAYGAGGSLETVRACTGSTSDRVPSPTGVYFDHQTVESMIDGILHFEALEAKGAFEPHSIRRWAERFSTPVFLCKLRQFILDRVPEAGEAIAPEFEAEYLSRAL
jgi:glycosyltransferase involved in cell wall biosynthesis